MMATSRRPLSLGQQPGFVSCEIDAHDPSAFSYNFETGADARLFKAEHEAATEKFTYFIPISRPRTVIETPCADPLTVQWQRLCSAQDAARAEVTRLFSRVNSKMSAVAKGSRQNPSLADVDASNKAWQHRNEISKLMQEFARQHAR